MKKLYMTPKMETVLFLAHDVITDSHHYPGEDDPIDSLETPSIQQ